MLRLQKNRTRSILIATAATLIFAGSVAAQQSTQVSQKFTDFIGEADEEHIKANLDNFVIELQKHPTAQAQIIGYRTRTAPAAVSLRYAQVLKDYLIRVRGMDRKRVVTVDGGMTGCFMYELWIVPPGALPPERQFTYTYPKDSADSKPASKRPRLRR